MERLTRVMRWLSVFVVLMSLALPANAQVSMPETFIGPDGQKQFGPYTWVWHSESFQPVKGPVSVQARCPAGDVVLGGGVMAGPLFSDISNSKPNPNFDGWRVHFYKKLQGGTFTVTVYASCAPTQ